MPRLFSGIEIPADICSELTHLQTGLDEARWIVPTDFHITLRFAGDIDGNQADEFSGFLSNIHFTPFEITLQTMGSFGGNRPRAVWIGMENSQDLLNLHHAHEMAAQHAGLKPESRKFTPHITLARLRNISPAETARYLEQKGLAKLPPFTVSKTALFSARPGGGGGPYKVEETYPASSDYGDETYDEDYNGD